jgi:hypothetical protein
MAGSHILLSSWPSSVQGDPGYFSHEQESKQRYLTYVRIQLRVQFAMIGAAYRYKQPPTSRPATRIFIDDNNVSIQFCLNNFTALSPVEIVVARAPPIPASRAIITN